VFTNVIEFECIAGIGVVVVLVRGQAV